MVDIGYWALALCLAVSLYSAVALVLGARRSSLALLHSARNGVYAGAGSATVAAATLACLLFARDFSVRYVYEHTSTYLSSLYALTAFWAGQEGSLLLWLWFSAVLAATLASSKRAWGEVGTPYALAVLLLTQAFLALVLLFASNPFQLLAVAPAQGRGLNPLLQNIGMVFHPPVVFLGYALYTVVFALAISSLVTGDWGRAWLRQVRFWALLAWLFLSVGIILGAWWAYLELGWGGYWAWDPVENASLLPWLTGAALLHSLMMQERRGTSKVWNLSLISLTFFLCVFATLVTRSGFIQSVHAFGRSSLGLYFVAYILLASAATVALIQRRRRLLGDGLSIPGLLSREASLLLTVLLFCGAALVVFLGTIFPTLTEALQGRPAALGAEFYGQTITPLAGLIILIIGICPWLAWGGLSPYRLWGALRWPLLAAFAAGLLLFIAGIRHSFALLSFAACAFVVTSIVCTICRQVVAQRRTSDGGILRVLVSLGVKNRRRYGAHLVHLGVVFIAIGVTGSSIYRTEAQVTLSPGESVTHQGYTLQYRGLVKQSSPGKERFTAVLAVNCAGRELAILRPEKNYHLDVGQWVSEVAVRTTFREDLYVGLGSVGQGDLATFLVMVNPLVVWLWIGGALLLVGAAIAWWPSRTLSED